MNPKYSIVTPVYRSETTLRKLHQQVVATMEELGDPFEIVFVEDCSPDNSWRVLEEIAKEDSRVVVVQLMQNFGQARATMCGLHEVRDDIVITIDDDLQTPPEEIKMLVDTINAEPELDVLFGIPKVKRHSWYRNLGSVILNFISQKMLRRNSIKMSSFRLVRRAALNELLQIKTHRPAPGALLHTITSRVKNVLVEYRTREEGQGGYSFSKLIGLTLDIILSYSTYPLRFLAFFGILSILGSGALTVFYLFRYFIGGITIAGWITQTIILIGSTGFNFFAFGILGEYILRILQNVQGYSQFVVQQKINKVDNGDK